MNSLLDGEHGIFDRNDDAAKINFNQSRPISGLDQNFQPLDFIEKIVKYNTFGKTGESEKVKVSSLYPLISLMNHSEKKKNVIMNSTDDMKSN